MLDDHLGILRACTRTYQRLCNFPDETPAEDTISFASAAKWYSSVNLKRNLAKAHCRKAVLTSWGAENEGKKLMTGPIRSKLAAFMYITSYVAQTRISNVLSLQRLQGAMAYAFSYCRPLFSLLFHLCKIQSWSGSDTELFALSRPVVNELMLASVLATVSIVSLDKTYDDKIFSVDASEVACGIVEAEAPKSL